MEIPIYSYRNVHIVGFDGDKVLDNLNLYFPGFHEINYDILLTSMPSIPYVNYEEPEGSVEIGKISELWTQVDFENLGSNVSNFLGLCSLFSSGLNRNSNFIFNEQDLEVYEKDLEVAVNGDKRSKTSVLSEEYQNWCNDLNFQDAPISPVFNLLPVLQTSPHLLRDCIWIVVGSENSNNSENVLKIEINKVFSDVTFFNFSNFLERIFVFNFKQSKSL